MLVNALINYLNVKSFIVSFQIELLFSVLYAKLSSLIQCRNQINNQNTTKTYL